MSSRSAVVARPLRDVLQQRLLAAPFDPANLRPDELRARLTALLRDEAPLTSDATATRVLDELVADVDGLGPLQALLSDPTIDEIMVNGPHRVFVERNGHLEPVACDLDAAAIVRITQRVLAPLGLRLDRAAPMVDARLPDGSRLHAIVPPLAVDGPCVTIRRFATDGVGLEAFGVTRTAAAFLRWAVAQGANVVVSGGTSAGKTTLCNALAGAMPPGDRVVTIEETAELRLPLPHVVRLEARLPNAEGAGGVPVRALVRAALRMRPDRLIVGEVRGGEAFDLLQALNTGHDGSLTTVHANGVEAVVDRLTALVLMSGVGVPAEAAHLQIAEAIDYVVHVVRRDGRRRIQTVGEVTRQGRSVAVVPLFEWRDGALTAVGAPSRRPRRPDAPAPEPRWFRC